MSAEMIIGLRISLIGLGVTFLALGLLSLVMRYLTILFPAQKPDLPYPKIIEKPQDSEIEEMVVALAVGICLLEERNAIDYRDPNLGSLLEIK